MEAALLRGAQGGLQAIRKGHLLWIREPSGWNRIIISKTMGTIPLPGVGFRGGHRKGVSID